MKVAYISVILWALCILLSTTNNDFQSLLFARDICLHIRLFPNLSDLFITSDIQLDNKSYVFQKTGHALSFGILFLLLNKAIKDHRLAIALYSLFAFFTEVLQLFFERSRRLVDVVIDIDQFSQLRLERIYQNAWRHYSGHLYRHKETIQCLKR